jgi:hypothetical protein
MEKWDYVFLGLIMAAVSGLFLAVSSYEVEFYPTEVYVQIISTIPTIIGFILLGYGLIKPNRNHSAQLIKEQSRRA